MSASPNPSTVPATITLGDSSPGHVPVTVAQVRDWVCQQGLAQYADAFTANDIDGKVLPFLTSAELRDDLGVLNLAHRHQLLAALSSLSKLSSKGPKPPQPLPDALPEHGRILDHLSNVRTYHSWVRVGVQLFSFALVIIRLAPDFRNFRFVAAMAYYLSIVGLAALIYAIVRYRAVVHMIDSSTLTEPQYAPDRLGVLTLLLLIFLASIMCFVMIALDKPDT